MMDGSTYANAGAVQTGTKTTAHATAQSASYSPGKMRTTDERLMFSTFPMLSII